jgi:bifunctional pyridoxal-dependent enzyme with beta-cystathionase and maltose regulon repressor activities
MVGVEELSLAELRERRSAKWRTYPPDVLPVPVAEVDFPVAAPIAEALAGFAARRWDWRLDPARVALARRSASPSSRCSACWSSRAIGW